MLMLDSNELTYEKENLWLTYDYENCKCYSNILASLYTDAESPNIIFN